MYFIIPKNMLLNFQEIKPIAGIWKPDKFLKAVQLNRWVVLNLDQHTNIQSIK